MVKEQGIEDIIEPSTFNNGQQDTEQGLKQTNPIQDDSQSGDRKHQEDGKYECDQCYNNYATKSSLYIYKQSKHEGVRYECDKCEYKAVMKSDITKHKQANLKGVKYECNQCEYKST